MLLVVTVIVAVAAGVVGVPGAAGERIDAAGAGGVQAAVAGPSGMIAFIRNSEFGEVFLMRQTGGGQRQLTARSARVHDDSAPTWSPSGNRIVFWRQLSGFGRDEERLEALYLIDSDGS
ncbi:MAG: TolB family protein, partial [Verrucomicrobiota bacterium]